MRQLLGCDAADDIGPCALKLIVDNDCAQQELAGLQLQLEAMRAATGCSETMPWEQVYGFVSVMAVFQGQLEPTSPQMTQLVEKLVGPHDTAIAADTPVCIILMPRMECDLDALLRRMREDAGKERLQLHRILQASMSLFSQVKHYFDAGVIHRDICLSNVLVKTDGSDGTDLDLCIADPSAATTADAQTVMKG